MTLPDLERRVDLARQFVARGLSHQAIETLREVLALDPDHPVAHALMSLALIQVRRLRAADHEAARAMTCDPYCFDAHHASALVRLEQGRYEDAQFHLTWCLDQRPSNAVSLGILGRLRIRQSRFADARVVFEEALRGAPDDFVATVGLGELDLAANDGESARRRAEVALRARPEDPDALVLMGQALFHQGSFADAHQHAVWALRSDMDHSGGLALLTALKARGSAAAGLWWRYHSWLGRFGHTRSTVVLLAGLLVFSLLDRVARDLGGTVVVAGLQGMWFAFVTYAWLGSLWFQRALDAELGQVRLRDE